MTNEELKKKIVDIALHAEWMDMFGDHNSIGKYAANAIADALIAAGIGDVKRHRVFVSKDGKEVKQFYSGEEVENILKERKELKDELRSKVEYMHEQDEVIKEYKHRAEVAERALDKACADMGQLMDCCRWAANGGVITIEEYTPEKANAACI